MEFELECDFMLVEKIFESGTLPCMSFPKKNEMKNEEEENHLLI